MSWLNFVKAFDETMKHEGGYVHDPDDAGGETFMGISRKYNPHWPGWALNLKDLTDKNKEKVINRYVWSFYKQHYWNPCRLDFVAEISMEIAKEMFDTAVNMGTHRACKFFQETLNYLNRNELIFKDLVVDGMIGTITKRAFIKLMSINRNLEIESVLKVMNILQGAHYLNYMKKSPIQEKYARGWFKRVNITKDRGKDGNTNRRPRSP